jgi:hypothetical protein
MQFIQLKYTVHCVQRFMPVIPTLRRLRQEDHVASLVYIARPHLKKSK